MDRPRLRVGFVPGVEPDRFLRRWKAARHGAWLDLVPVPWSRQEEALAAGEADMMFVRHPVDPARDWHRIDLWEERPCVVVSRDHLLSLAEEVTPEDLADQTPLPARHRDDAAERVAVAATGVGYAPMPLSLARLHHRKDTVHRLLTDTPPTRIALIWSREDDDELRQDFVGVVRGRTPRSSR